MPGSAQTGARPRLYREEIQCLVCGLTINKDNKSIHDERQHAKILKKDGKVPFKRLLPQGQTTLIFFAKKPKLDEVESKIRQICGTKNSTL